MKETFESIISMYNNNSFSAFKMDNSRKYLLSTELQNTNEKIDKTHLERFATLETEFHFNQIFYLSPKITGCGTRPF